MTTYTAATFEFAEFARHPDGKIAARLSPGAYCPWVGQHATLSHSVLTDADMARGGWVPVPAGSYTRTDEDSGVAAEALTGSTLAAHFRDKRDMERARAEKAEQERDEARGALRARLGVLAEPRPLTPDAITDEMVKRGVEKFRSLPTGMSAHARVSVILTAALTEPPARPEGAAYWDGVIADQVAGDLTPEVIQKLADIIATKSAENGA